MTIDPQLSKEIKDYIESQVEKKVKSIQVKYLRENFLTREEFLKSLKHLDKRFNEMQTQMDKRFEEMQTQMDRRFEAMDKRFEEMQTQMDRRFENVFKRFDQLSFGHTDIIEGMAYTVIKREFDKRGLDFKLTKNHHFDDEENFVHPDTTDIEIDIFNVNPNVIAEATLKVTDIEKIRTFIRKIQFIEKKKHVKFNKYFFCYMIYDSIEADVKRLLRQYDIELIMPDQDQNN